MAAYILVEVEITDPQTYAEYVKRVPATLAAYGGRFIVRGGEAETLEGDWAPKRIVAVEFESVAKAKAWWASPEYSEAKAMRQSASKGQMIVVQGVD